MKGSKKVIAALNKQLTAELSAADQYNTHAEMYADWGLHALYERMHHEKDEELEHAKRLIERILFLEGVPDTASREPIKIGKTVPEMMKNDLEHEYHVISLLKKAIKIAEEEDDFQTRAMLTVLLDDSEEDHAHWLEQQVRLIDMMGLQNYIQFKAAGEPTPQG
ncbi:bacterioferritin [Thalassospira lucentensis]|uniref:bacterioferritin n=1 Tax=Thalassospira lucentensis TaxID=168935 RepID=UPI00142E4D84|nr:bacterioferritin [Thalassospira lucentensis]NIZ02080.1 bacterioferritin [Thalassospira lucentensis]